MSLGTRECWNDRKGEGTFSLGTKGPPCSIPGHAMRGRFASHNLHTFAKTQGTHQPDAAVSRFSCGVTMQGCLEVRNLTLRMTFVVETKQGKPLLSSFLLLQLSFVSLSPSPPPPPLSLSLSLSLSPFTYPFISSSNSPSFKFPYQHVLWWMSVNLLF